MLKNQKDKKISGSERVRAARKRAKKGQYASDINYKNVVILVAALIVLLIFIVFGINKAIKFVGSLSTESVEPTTELAIEKLKKQITIDEIDITGMTMSEAKSK